MYTVYRTENIHDGKFYIGVHKTDNPNDSYLGSGIAIKAAVRSLGRSSFKKTVLHCFETPAEAYLMESQLVTQVEITNPLCYNLTIGGIPTADWLSERHEHYKRNVKTFLGRKHTEETKRKISDAGKGRIQSKETKEKRAAKLRGGTHPNRMAPSDDSNRKRSIAHLNTEKVVCPVCSKAVSPQNAKRWHFEECKPRRPRRGQAH